jgi:hypothetical protein
MTSIENLSNELFHNIFDYLEASDLYMAFSNLNHRFQQLLNNSSLLFKIKQTRQSLSDATCFQNWMQIMNINRQQILSIRLLMSLNCNNFFSLLYINSSLQRLESIVLFSPQPNTLMLILDELISLPRLFSLTIKPYHFSRDLTDIYRIVLALPVLKYYSITLLTSQLSISLPISTNQQPSTIEYLIIDHVCSFNDLSMVLSYTPRLRHLSFHESYEVPGGFGTTLPFTLTNLTHLRVRTWCVKFNEFEIFIRQTCPKLKVLHWITHSDDIAYLDAHRCEEFILQNLPQLEKFSLQYYECIGDDEDHVWKLNFGGSNPFSSSFWLERRWLLDVRIEYESIVYSIGPYKYIVDKFPKLNRFVSFRKRWYEQPNVDNSTMELTESTRLSLLYIPSDESYEFQIMYIENILDVTRIYHFEIPEEEILLDILIQMINALPQVTTLKLHSLSIDQVTDSETEEPIVFPMTTSTNRITKVYLEKMFIIEEVYSLMKLCSNMSYLKVNSLDNMKVDVFIRNIFNKINCESNQYLRLLCVPAPTNDDSIIKILETMKNKKKSLDSYTIKHVGDHIFLQWK